MTYESFEVMKKRVPSPEKVRARIEDATEARIALRVEALVVEYIIPAMEQGLHEVTIDVNREHHLAYLVGRLGELEVVDMFMYAGYTVTNYVSSHGGDWDASGYATRVTHKINADGSFGGSQEDLPKEQRPKTITISW